MPDMFLDKCSAVFILCFWLRIGPFTQFRLLGHGGCDRSTGDAYSSLAPDRTAGISRVRVCHALIILSFLFLITGLITLRCLCLFMYQFFFYHKLNPKTQSGLPRTYINLSIIVHLCRKMVMLIAVPQNCQNSKIHLRLKMLIDCFGFYAVSAILQLCNGLYNDNTIYHNCPQR